MEGVVTLNKKEPAKNSRLVVPLQKNVESGQPYFVVSGLGGHVIAFQILDKIMPPGWRGHGVLYPGFLGETSAKPSIDSFARAMLDEVLQAQPEGPYLFAGYSMGGSVCLEMARELKARGEQVGVVLIDVKIYDEAKLRNVFERLPRQLSWKIKNLWLTFTGSKAKRKRQLRVEQLYKAENMPNIMPESFDRVMQEGRKAVEDYTLLPSDVPAVLLKCREMIWYDDLYKWKQDYGWGRYTKLLKVIKSPGNHITMIKQPNAKQFVQHMDEAFKALLSESQVNL